VADANDIDDNELLYRKVSVNSGWYDPQSNDLKPEAFKPRPDDTTGISFDRAKSELHPEFRTIEEAGQGPSMNGYYVAVFRVSDLRQHGFSLTPDPCNNIGNPGHVLMDDLTYDNRKEVESQNKMVRLAHELTLRVEGPFSS
jgi:hypothetical protein